MTTFSKKKKKDFSLNVIAKTYLQDFNFERYFLADGCLVKRFLIGGHLSRKLSKKTKSPVSYKSQSISFVVKNGVRIEYYSNTILYFRVFRIKK